MDTGRSRLPRGSHTEHGRSKFRELILWLCAGSETDPHFGATKLNKLLFFIDLEALKQTGKTISGQKYQKLKQGPAPRAIVPLLREMQEQGEVVTRKVSVLDYAQNKTFALREPDQGVFSAIEIAIMRTCLDKFWRKTAKNVSVISHDFIGWQVVKEGDTIPLGAVFISKRTLTPEEKEYALTLQTKHTGTDG